MNKDDIFWGLVEYHISHNLTTWLKIMDEHNNYIELVGGVPIKSPRLLPISSKDENKGELDFLSSDGKIQKRKIDGAFIVLDQRSAYSKFLGSLINNSSEHKYKISTFSNIQSILLNSENSDGGYILSKNMTELKRVQSFKNEKIKKLMQSIGIKKLQQYLPKDFFDYDSKIKLVGTDGSLNLGNRTSTALALSTQYAGIDSFLIKQTSYTDFGLGKVIHFDNHGLDEEFFLTTKPETGKGYANHDGGIFGVYRNYRLNSKNRLHRASIELKLHQSHDEHFVIREEYEKELYDRLGSKQRKLLGL